MQTNLKFSTLNYLTPVNRLRQSKYVHALLSLGAGAKGSDNYYLYLEHMLNCEKLNWKYVRVAHDQNKNIYLMEGNELNGYYINTNSSITNRDMIEKIFELLDIQIPYGTKQKIKVKFYFQKVENGIYLLKKI
jgi:hypothetical protein